MIDQFWRRILICISAIAAFVALAWAERRRVLGLRRSAYSIGLVDGARSYKDAYEGSDETDRSA